MRQRLGLGAPTEDPFFADIYAPSDVAFEPAGHLPAGGGERVPAGGLRRVRVFVHGGFLQFGSTSGSTYNQQFFAAEHFGEVRVLLGHRCVLFSLSSNLLFRFAEGPSGGEPPLPNLQNICLIYLGVFQDTDPMRDD